MRIETDVGRCIGTACCVAVAPEVFRLGQGARVEVFDPGGASDDTVYDAATSCPTGAISLRGEDGMVIPL